MTEEIPGEVKTFSSPRLTAEERLYVRGYLSTLSHRKAHELVCPGLKAYQTNNQFAKRSAVQFHIQLGLQERAEAISLTPEVILEKLFKEATREGPGSNHAARIQALTQLGKHLGLFEEKKENNSYTFNIVNYSPEDPLPSQLVSQEQSLLEDKEELVDLPNVTIQDYT